MNTSQTTTGWDWRGVLAVARRDLMVVRGSRPVMVPMIVVPALLAVVLPLGIGLVARFGDGMSDDMEGVEDLLSVLPGELAGVLAEDPAAALLEVTLVYLLSPMLLIVPVMTSSVIAADSIAGERERKTLEGLLLTPLTDREVFAAKLIGAMVPAIAIDVAAGMVYGIVGNVAAAGVVDGLLFPNPVWAGLVFWVGPALAAISLGVTVIVSARVKTVQEAFQIGGIVVLPVVALMVVQATGLLALAPLLLVIAGLVAWIIAAIVLRVGMGAVSRTYLGERL